MRMPMNIGTVLFALAVAGLDVISLTTGHFAAVWQPVPMTLPARLALAYANSALMVVLGSGLLWRRTLAHAAACAGRFGLFTAQATWTHLLTYQLTAGGQTFELAGTQGPSGISGDTGNPKDRATLTVSWEKGPFTLSPSLEFTGHFNIVDPSSGVDTCSQALGFIGYITSGVSSKNSGLCSVGYFLLTNVYGAYQVNGHLQLHASVLNLFNKQPPIDVQTYGGGTYSYPYDPAFDQAGAVGRFFEVGATYNF